MKLEIDVGMVPRDQWTKVSVSFWVNPDETGIIRCSIPIGGFVLVKKRWWHKLFGKVAISVKPGPPPFRGMNT